MVMDRSHKGGDAVNCNALNDPTARAVLILVAILQYSPSFAQQPAYLCEGFAAPTGPPAPMVTTKEGVVWYAATDANRLVRIEKDRSTTPVVPVDGATAHLSGLAAGADGSIWYSKTPSSRIGRIPADGSEGVEFALPAAHSFPSRIAASADGRIWYADPVLNQVGYITLDGNVISYQAPSIRGAPVSPQGIAVAGDNSVWVTSVGHNAIYRVDPASGDFKRFDIATPNAQPNDIALGADGNLWFTMPAVSKIGRITPRGQITEFASGLIGLQYVAAGPDGATWYSSRQGIGRIDPGSGRVDTYPCAGFGAMTTGPDGHLWVLGDSHVYVVKARSEGTAARVTARAQIPAALPSNSLGARIETVSADGVAALIAASPGRVVVQYSSRDPGCGYCVRNNSRYEDLAAMSNPNIKFLRVFYAPWTSAGSSGEASRVKLLGLPTIIVFQNGKEISRCEDAPPAEMKSKLGL
jgi:virginiamycin B lyase